MTFHIDFIDEEYNELPKINPKKFDETIKKLQDKKEIQFSTRREVVRK